MDKQDINKLDKAHSLIFEVEQKWKKEGYSHISHTLFKARLEINNTKNGRKTTEIPE